MANGHLGYFENFHGANTILVCGDEERLQRLADLLRSLEDASADPVDLQLLPFVQVHGGVSLVACPGDCELGVRRTGSPSSFVWRLSVEGWLESADKIEAVARGGCGHCYLGETTTGDAVVMASKDEYDESWWERHDRLLEMTND